MPKHSGGAVVDNPILNVKNEDEAVIALKNLYRTYGYLPYKMSKFEEYDLYVENKKFLVSDDIITFSDFNGKLMALKPDVTLSIIKKVKASQDTEKLFYHENVYRALKNTKEVREILQMGLECIGEVGIYETAEVIMLAGKSLATLSENYVIDISHVGLINGILDAAQVDFAVRTQIMAHLKEKNPHDIKKICQAAGVDDNITDKICKAATIWGGFSQILPKLDEISVNKETETAIEELRQIYTILEINGCGDRVKIDFSVMNDMSYYNGVVFRGFVEGVPVNVLSGGRYDKLLERFGKKSGAIGFAVYLGILWQYIATPKTQDADVVIYYYDDTDLALLTKKVKELTEMGSTVTVYKKSCNKPLKCAKKFEIIGGRLVEI